MFYIYEIYLDQCPEIGKIEDNPKIYEQLSQKIKNKILEIIHPNDIGRDFIIMKISINSEIKSIKLQLTATNDKTN